MDNTTMHPSSEPLAHIVDLFLFKGRPRNLDANREVRVLVNHGFVVGYCPDRLQALWSAYRVAHADRDVDYDRPHLYYDDTRLDATERIGPETFGTHDGVQYHVGHLTPNEVINNQFGRLAQMETFLMSNMSPQRGSLNTGVWLTLENMVRNIEDTPNRDHVWALAGPVFDAEPAMIQRPNGVEVPIPESYYYITVDPNRYPWDRPSNVDVVCFLIPQDAPPGTPVTQYLCTLAEIEDATHLDFFPQWPPTAVAAVPETPTGEPAIPEDVWLRHRLLRQAI